MALYAISIRQARDLPPPFFRFCLTADTLGLSYILPAAGRIRDFHPLERALTGRTRKNIPHYASWKRTVWDVYPITRLLSNVHSKRLSSRGQRHILRCRWYWKAVCPAPDINRKRTCTPTCKAACRSVPPPWRTAAQSLLHPARRGRAIFISRGILQCAGTSTEAMKATNTEYSTWALHKFQSPMPTKP